MADMGLVVVGAGGRMGRMLVKTISETEGCTLAGAIEQPGSIALGEDAGLLAGAGRANIAITDDPDAAFAHADGVLDFTAPAASVGFADIAAKTGIVHVVGTTGLEESHFAKLRAAAARARIVQSGNMSLGVNLLAALVKKVAATLGEEFDIEVLEMHHRMKVDAPSGTALLLGEAAAAGRAIALKERAVRSRDGHTGARRPGDIGFATLARRHGRRRALGHLRRPGRAHRAHAQGRGPRPLRPRRDPGGAVGARPEARLLHHGRRARAVRPLSARPSFARSWRHNWTASSSSSATARASGTSRTCSPAGRTPA